MNQEPLPAQGPVDVNVGQLRDWLEQQGFSFGNNQFLGQMNDCNWYARRRSKLSARDCDCNGPKIQIVLTPHSYERDGKRWESVEVDVTGECSGVWYKLKAYSMTPAELVARLDDVEAALIRAWNSLMPNRVANRREAGRRSVRFSAGLEGMEVAMQWIDAAKAKPEPGKAVLVALTEDGRQRWARACWIPKHYEEDTGNYEGDPDYDEAHDTYYWPRGWYEWNHCEETHWILTGDVTHWALVDLPSN